MEGELNGYAEEIHHHTVARVSLKEILHRFASPLSEEHAWAVLYQIVQKFARHDRESFGASPALYKTDELRHLCCSAEAVLTLEGVSLSEDGEVFIEKLNSKRRRYDGELESIFSVIATFV